MSLKLESNQSCIFQSDFINITIVLFNLFASTVFNNFNSQGHLRSYRESIRSLRLFACKMNKLMKPWLNCSSKMDLALILFYKINIL